MRLLLVTFQAPVFPTFQWNKSWGVNQPASVQSAPVASAPELNAGVSSYSTHFAPVFPTNFHWNKSWGVNQPNQVTQTASVASAPAPTAPVASYSPPIAPAVPNTDYLPPIEPTAPVASSSAPLAYKYVTFNQPPQIENKIYTEPAPVSYSRQAPATNWNFNKYWGFNPAPAVAHQSTVQVKPVTFTIPSISIPIPTLNWNFNKNWGTNQVQGIQSKTNVEQEEEVPIQNPQPTVQTFEKTVEAQNVYKPLVASKRIDVNLSVG